MVRPAAAVAVLLLALAAGAAAASNDGAGRRGVRGGYTAPWTLCRMRPALTAAKLQVRPKYEKSIRNLVGWSSPEFYVKDDAVEFVMEGTSHRSELRFNAEWSTASAEPQRLVGLVHLPAPDHPSSSTRGCKSTAARLPACRSSACTGCATATGAAGHTRGRGCSRRCG
eukprot:TRINITY_DN3018_c0_g1_i1.p2 TRINITY_DN3018_c0_g1~~TRINITY_DN3018_c0_g1_i1.p2  ORF type:complete len:169 (+),score=34.14 TRINITY_DN3018_c0_g1_i1:235-741(+)